MTNQVKNKEFIKKDKKLFNKEGLVICKGGKLIKTKWIFDDKKNKGKYISHDVSKHVGQYLFEPVELSKKLTLKDIFKLVNEQNTFMTLVFGNWLNDFIDEALNKKSKKYSNSQKDDIEYLEVYVSLQEDGDKVWGLVRPNFHGVGVIQPENYIKDGVTICAKGERIQYNISGEKINKLVNIPIKISEKITISFENDEGISLKEPVLKLADLLNAIFWEISFFGNPENRNKVTRQIFKVSKKNKKGAW